MSDRCSNCLGRFQPGEGPQSHHDGDAWTCKTAARELGPLASRAGWTSRWVHDSAMEVFTSPTGQEYVRAMPGELADLSVESKSGLPTLRLMLRGTSRMERLAKRRERKDERELRRASREAFAEQGPVDQADGFSA